MNTDSQKTMYENCMQKCTDSFVEENVQTWRQISTSLLFHFYKAVTTTIITATPDHKHLLMHFLKVSQMVSWFNHSQQQIFSHFICIMHIYMCVCVHVFVSVWASSHKKENLVQMAVPATTAAWRRNRRHTYVLGQNWQQAFNKNSRCQSTKQLQNITNNTVWKKTEVWQHICLTSNSTATDSVSKKFPTKLWTIIND